MAEFVMPSLGADMQAGTLVAWRKQPGEAVARGEIIAEVETEKGLIEVECFTAGVVERLLVATGAKVPVGTPLAILSEGGAAKQAAAGVEPARAETAGTTPVVRADTARTTPGARRRLRELGITPQGLRGTGTHGAITRADVAASQEPAAPAVMGAPIAAAMPVASRPRVSPLARALAVAGNIPLSSLTPSGPQGSIIARDVERARPAPRVDPDPRARMRAAIGAAMARSKREIPHYYLSHTVDLGRLTEWLGRENERRTTPERLLMAVLFTRAVARALLAVPELNAHYVGDAAPPLANIHVGVAVSLRGGGLVAPAIMNADQLGLDELSRAFKDVVNRARAGRLTSSELGGGTITVTSLGERGVEAVFPIIMPPQVAMVGFGTVTQRPMVVDSSVVARPAVTVSLAADHRVSDGHRGALFLSTLATILEEPPLP